MILAALVARALHVVGGVTADMLGMVCVGSLIGLAGGLASERFVEGLLFHVKTTDVATLLAPILTLAAAAILAALPPAIRAVRIDPAQTQRAIAVLAAGRKLGLTYEGRRPRRATAAPWIAQALTGGRMARNLAMA